MTSPNPQASPAPVRFDAVPLIAAPYLGVAVSSMLYGILCTQIPYFLAFLMISGYSKWNLIWTVVPSTLDSAQQALVIYSNYYDAVLNFANPAVFLNDYWPFFTVLILDIVEAFLLQSFLVFRIWRLSRNLWLTAICGALALTHLGKFVFSSVGGKWFSVVDRNVSGVLLVFPIKSFTLRTSHDAVTELKVCAFHYFDDKDTTNIRLPSVVRYKWIVCVASRKYRYRCRYDILFKQAAHGIQTVRNLLPTSRELRIIFSLPRSDNIITKLIILTLTTGSLPSSFELGELLAYLISPTAFYDLFFSFAKGKLYVLSLLTMWDDLHSSSNSSESRRFPFSAYTD
ncbi:hypothetical protein NM688_g6161 [Phlebia brevispora]|uniref:Uncharacterized protein n=1 Tax=Phlebia brevispora TaxID=194682 RepID=A0ACC1SJE2_9APHY|nr:hypothetical protein NM688_g6161 [Phlebia brevispora]